MALLVKLPNATFPNNNKFSHVMFEVQLAAQSMYEAKTSKDPNAPSGHEMYKVARAVTETCEYLLWTNYDQITPRFADAPLYYEPLEDKYWQSFTSYVTGMWDMYRDAQEWLTNQFDKAVYESKWYETNKSRIKKPEAPAAATPSATK
jgi:hypothetical protein